MAKKETYLYINSGGITEMEATKQTLHILYVVWVWYCMAPQSFNDKTWNIFLPGAWRGRLSTC